MREFPVVPTYLGKVDYGLLPMGIVNVLEQSGVIGYLTQSNRGETAFHNLISALTRACLWDTLTAKINPELLIRSLCAGWLRYALDETETNSVASTADEFYKGLFAARDASAVNNPSITTTGLKGFQEQPKPEDWDMAIGQVLGFRKWHVMLPTLHDSRFHLQGSFSKDFLGHNTLDDGRRIAVCHNSGKHPADEVPADNGCGCGWWAYWSPSEAAKHAKSADTDGALAVTVAVEGTGRVVIGQKGFRAQYVKVVGLASDDKGEQSKLHTLTEFSRTHLMDAPVFCDVETLRKEIGCDPNYGTLGARYPELSNHNNETLAVYAWFVSRLKHDIGEFLTDYVTRTAGANAFLDQCNYLTTSVELLDSEYRISRQIVAERGSTVEDVCEMLRAEDENGKSGST